MTGKELFDRVLTLGGRKDYDEFLTDAKYNAANMALDDLNALFPVTDVARILHFPLRPVLSYPGITVHKGGEDIKFNASGVRSLAFAISGTGSVKLVNVSKKKRHPNLGGGFSEVERDLPVWFDGQERSGECYWEDRGGFSIIRYIGDTPCDVRLTFSGEFNYMIKDLAFYDDAVSELPEDVMPYSPWIKYDINGANYANGRFADFAAVPVTVDGDDPVPIDDYKIEGSCICLPISLEGVVEVRYRKRPTYLCESNLYDTVSIDTELHQLAVLRAAYYLYELEDPEAAERCLAEYNRQMPLVVSRLRKVKTPRKLKNVWGGW